MGAQPRLHMPHGDLPVIAGQGGDKGGGRVPVDQHDVGLFRLQHRLDLLQNGVGDVEEGLLVLHDGQIVVRDHPKGLQHLVEHLPVLSGDAHHGLYALSGLQLVDQGAHFYGLRSGAEDEHDLFHGVPPCLTAGIRPGAG